MAINLSSTQKLKEATDSFSFEDKRDFEFTFKNKFTNIYKVKCNLYKLTGSADRYTVDLNKNYTLDLTISTGRGSSTCTFKDYKLTKISGVVLIFKSLNDELIIEF